MVAKTEDEYVRLAVDLASDISALEELRMSLREVMIKSPVCDGESFTRGLESAYRTMWHRYCDGDSPALRRLQVLADADQTGQDLDKTADLKAQRAIATAGDDIKVNAASEGGVVNGVTSPPSPSGRCQANGHTTQ